MNGRTARLWNYATEHDLTIVTKDTDFSDRIILKEPPPRVIHIRIGNMRMRDFHAFLNRVWPEVRELSKAYKLVRIYQDRVECIG